MSVVKQAETKKAAEYLVSITNAFKQNNGDIKATARSLGVSREFVRRWCHRLNIDVNDYRKPKVKWTVKFDGKYIGEVMAINEEKAISEAMQRYDIDMADILLLDVDVPSPGSGTI